MTSNILTVGPCGKMLLFQLHRPNYLLLSDFK